MKTTKLITAILCIAVGIACIALGIVSYCYGWGKIIFYFVSAFSFHYRV